MSTQNVFCVSYICIIQKLYFDTMVSYLKKILNEYDNLVIFYINTKTDNKEIQVNKGRIYGGIAYEIENDHM